MFTTNSARAGAQSLAWIAALALSGLSGQAQAQVGTAASAPASHASVSEAVLHAAAAQADFSALAMASRSAVPARVEPNTKPLSPLFDKLLTADVAKPFHTAAAPPANSHDLQCLSQAVYFEARGEPAMGQAAVAQVVMNRVRHPAFPKSVCGVVFQRAGHSCQFSWACHHLNLQPGDSSQWRQARAVASRVLAGEVVAEIGFATHFNGAHARGFGAGLQRVAQIGAHAFYRFGGAKGAASMFRPAIVRVAQNEAPAQSPARAVYASLAPLPSKAETDRLLASASSAVHSAAAAAESAATNLMAQVHPASPKASAAPSAPAAQPTLPANHPEDAKPTTGEAS